MLNKEELKSDFEQFRRSVGKLMDLEDELALISIELRGNNLSSPRIKSKEEAKYKQGSRIYHNNIADLMEREEQLIRQRDYYLFRINRVAAFLQVLTDEEVELLEYRYWFNYPMLAIADFPSVATSLGNLYKRYDAIFEKMRKFSSKIVL